MTRRYRSTAAPGHFLAVIAVALVVAGCGGGSGNTTTPPAAPAVSLSISTLTFASQNVGSPSAAQSVTLSNTGSAALVLSSITVTGDYSQTNTCGTTVSAGGSCTISVTFTPTASGSRPGALTITDNAGTSPQTVTLTGTGASSSVSLSTTSLTFATQIMVGTPSVAQPVTLNNTGTQPLTITSISASGAFSETDNCDGSLSVGASCTLNVTFTPTAAGTLNGTLTITDNSNGVAGTTQTVALTGSGFSGNSVAVTVDFGLPGNTGGPGTNYYDAVFTTLTVCVPGTTTCQTIPNILVDTGSVGLRVLSNQLGSVTLPQLNDGQGDNLYECIEYGDLSYNFGSVNLATVQMGGETASQVPGQGANSGIPIQVITAGGVAPAGASCLSGGGPSDNSVAALGANGILGIGNYPQDCGSACTSSSTDSLYFLCSTTTCGGAGVPLPNQLWNPVSAFASADTNGAVLQLPSIPAAGQATAAGTLVFGIETETCPAGAAPGCVPNLLGTAQVYALDGNGNFASIVFNGLTYFSASNPAFLDTGSNGLYISDAATLGISDCTVGGTNIGLYCPSSSPFNLTNIVLTDNNGVKSAAMSLSIANALTLFSNNPAFAAFDNLGGDSGTGPTTDYFDFGLPFFFGRNVFTGIVGTTAPNNASVPNGYLAF